MWQWQWAGKRAFGGNMIDCPCEDSTGQVAFNGGKEGHLQACLLDGCSRQWIVAEISANENVHLSLLAMLRFCSFYTAIAYIRVPDWELVFCLHRETITSASRGEQEEQCTIDPAYSQH